MHSAPEGTLFGDESQPYWVHNDGLLRALSEHLRGWDWQFFTSTCRALRRASTFNTELTVDLLYCNPFFREGPDARPLPLGTTSVTLALTGHSPFLEVDPAVIAAKALARISDTLPSRTSILEILEIPNMYLVSLRFSPNVTSLSLSWCLDCWPPQEEKSFPLACLPPQLRMLTFHNFNYRLSGSEFPNTLEHLDFGNRFNQPVQHLVLHEGLKKLIFGNGFNHNIELLNLPSSLTELRLGLKYDRRLKDVVWPPKLQCLSAGQSSETLNPSVLPPGCKLNHSLSLVEWFFGKKHHEEGEDDRGDMDDYECDDQYDWRDEEDYFEYNSYYDDLCSPGSDNDFTACDSDCGYCGHCMY